MTPRRSSGRTPGEETAKEVSEASQAPLDEVGLPTSRRFQGPAFQRLRTDWVHEDAVMVSRIKIAIERRLLDDFADAYRVLNAVWDIVRQPKVDEDGEPVRDLNGMVVWKTDDYGRYIEDWTLLTSRQRDDLMFSITTNLFAWEQKAAEAWSEAMFARAHWEEDFAISFDTAPSSKTTIEDRTHSAQRSAAEGRYFAVFLAGYSRQAEALTRSLERLSYRLERSLRS